MTHETFTLSRDIAATPATVWTAWTDPAFKKRWFADNDGPDWETLSFDMDVRVGGIDRGIFRHSGGHEAATVAGEHENVTCYLEIDEGRRLVFAYTMALNGRIHSASLGTVEIEPKDTGTRMTYTETLQAIGETDGVAGRKAGTEWLFDQLVAALAQETAQ